MSMTRYEFLDELRHSLSGADESTIQGSVDYYSEMIDDRMEAGMSEHAAVADIGSPQNAAREILIDLPLPTVIRTQCKKKRSLRAWEIVLLAVGSPIWLTLAVAALVILLAVYVVLWAVVACLWAADLVLAVFPLVCVWDAVVGGVGTAWSILLYAGAGIASAGLAILLFFGCLKVTVLFARLSACILRWIKSLIVGKKS